MCAREGWGKHYTFIYDPFTPQKIFGLNPSVSLGTGLTLHAREARGVAEIQWAAIEAAHQKNSKTDVCLIAVHYLENRAPERKLQAVSVRLARRLNCKGFWAKKSVGGFVRGKEKF